MALAAAFDRPDTGGDRVGDAPGGQGPAGGHGAHPVDLVHLARHTLGNRDLEQEVLRLFVRQSAAFLDKMKGAADHEQRARAAHTIKGSARGIGAWQVADCAEAVEGADAKEPLAALEGAIDEANAYINALLE